MANGNGHVSDELATESASSNGNGHNRLIHVPAGKQTKNDSTNGWGALLEESVKLRDQARDLATGLGQFIRTVKQQRKQNRLVETTLSSLKQIKGLV